MIQRQNLGILEELTGKKIYEAVLSLELEHCLLNYLNMSENRNNENFLLLKQISHKLQNCYKTRNKLR